MSKVWLLLEVNKNGLLINGVVSNHRVAEKWSNGSIKLTYDNSFIMEAREFELDDPELLNRITKESEKK